MFHCPKLLKFVHKDLELDEECIIAINKLCIHIILIIPIRINHSPKEFKKYIDDRFQLIYKIKKKPKINPFVVRKILKKFSPNLIRYSKINIYLALIIEHVIMDILTHVGNIAKMENKKIIDKESLSKYLAQNKKLHDLTGIIGI